MFLISSDQSVTIIKSRTVCVCVCVCDLLEVRRFFKNHGTSFLIIIIIII